MSQHWKEKKHTLNPIRKSRLLCVGVINGQMTDYIVSSTSLCEEIVWFIPGFRDEIFHLPFAEFLTGTFVTVRSLFQCRCTGNVLKLIVFISLDIWESTEEHKRWIIHTLALHRVQHVKHNILDHIFTGHDRKFRHYHLLHLNILIHG